MVRIEEHELITIVNEIGIEYATMIKLGIALEFQKATIDQYVEFNRTSPKGITDMLFAWKKKTSPENQKGKLREALIKAELIEIADTYLPKSETVTHLERTVTILQTSATQTVGLNTAAAQTGQKQSVELLCLKCERVTAKLTNVINTKRSDRAKRSKVRSIMGRECLVQLMVTDIGPRFDVITLTTADVEVGDEVFPKSGGFEGYKEGRCTWCKGCSEQVGWYFIPTDGNSTPFHALWLQHLIHDSYDSDNSLNVFFAQTRIE